MRKTKPTYISNVSVATKTENRKGITRNHQPSFAAKRRTSHIKESRQKEKKSGERKEASEEGSQRLVAAHSAGRLIELSLALKRARRLIELTLALESARGLVELAVALESAGGLVKLALALEGA
jgi:hypothetical protein